MTIKEIAALANVSISTVSKIMNGKDQNINAKTRSKVLKIVKEYNYAPYSAARNSSTSKTFCLGLLGSGLSQSGELLNGVLKTAYAAGYQLLLFDSGNSPETELKHITALCKSKVDGVIWQPLNADSLSHERYFTEQNISVCYLNAPETVCSCKMDFEKFGYALTQKLIDYKHTNIAYLYEEHSERADDILEGFKKCLYENQIAFHPQRVLRVSENCASEILTNNFSAIVCSSHDDALRIYEEMLQMHHHIPLHLSVVSFAENDRETASFPHVSCIRIPYEEFGCFLCSQLIALCEKLQENTSTVFSPEPVFNHEKSLTFPPYFRAKKLVVVGSINIDMTFNVEQLPQAGKTTRISNVSTALGGKGANQSIGASKLGREVSLIGMLGDDLDSRFILQTLEKENIFTEGIYLASGTPTGKAYVYTGSDGESTITILSGANGKLQPENILQQQHLFHHAGFCLISTEISIDCALAAAKVARACDAKVIVKPAALKSIPEELLLHTDIFIPNQKEASILCPQCTSTEEQADFFFNKGINIVIITLGHAGCYLKTEDNEQFFSSADFAPIDTTGGADAFISALASYLTDNYPIEKAIRIATYAAGFCVSRQGVVPALVDRDTLESYIVKLEPELLE